MNILMRLWQHPNGYFYAELERNRRRSLGTRDRAEAQKLYRRLRQEFLLNRVAFLKGRPPSKSLEDFSSEYLDLIYQTRSHNSWMQIRSAFRSLATYLQMGIPIGEITRRELDRIQADMTQTAKPSSINTRFRYLSAAFKKATEWGYLARNPFAGLKPLPEQETFPRYLEQGEIARILGAEKHPRYLALWSFLLLTGCRRAEAMALTWQDIDLPVGIITIRKTKNRRPKIVYISQDLRAVLQTLGPGIGRLWPWSLRQVSRRFQQHCLSLGIKARLHDLRHTYGSYMAMEGVDLLTIGKLMGHKSISSTQIYAHLSPAHLAQAQAKLANALNLRKVCPEK